MTMEQRFRYSTRSLKNLSFLHPEMIKFANELLSCSPYDLVITSGARTAEQQNELYQQGRTKKGQVVTNCDGYKVKSNHQLHSDGYGYAFDIAVIVDGKISWDPKYYKEVANSSRDLMKKYNVEWGGDWKSLKDYPHFELKKRGK